MQLEATSSQAMAALDRACFSASLSSLSSAVRTTFASTAIALAALTAAIASSFVGEALAFFCAGPVSSIGVLAGGALATP
jgi:hypothetical protein